jgi:hypothetical protein
MKEMQLSAEQLMTFLAVGVMGVHYGPDPKR